MSSRTGILRSNWRGVDTANDLGAALIGSNIVAGSFLPAAASGLGGASAVAGGFLMGSFASQLSGVGFLQISALGAISAFYGTGNVGVQTSGYRFFPFAMMDMSADGTTSGTAGVEYMLSTTQAIASNDSTVVIRVMKFSQTAGSVASNSPTVFTLASTISVHMMWAAWIISSPA